MTASALYFTGERTVERRPISVDDPEDGDVLVETEASAISAGTERRVYREELPESPSVAPSIDGLDDDFEYPMPYGYCAVGRVVDVGASVEESWLGRRVFAFRPHQTRFRADPADLVVVPDGVDPAHATLLPTLETATNLALDSRPRLGERVACFGAGVVGLCTARLLSAFPLSELVVVEPIERRRTVAAAFGADRTLDSAAGSVSDVDLAVELSGQPAVLDDALEAVGYDGRIVVGSWYGSKRAPIDLGGRFHRDRIEIVSSQVSTIAPELRGRWDRQRRFETALEWLTRIECDELVSHQMPFSEAADAYRLLDSSPAEALQVVLTY